MAEGMKALLGYLPDNEYTQRMITSGDPAAINALSCDPCECPDNYIYGSGPNGDAMFKKMVIKLLCDIAGE